MHARLWAGIITCQSMSFILFHGIEHYTAPAARKYYPLILLSKVECSQIHPKILPIASWEKKGMVLQVWTDVKLKYSKSWIVGYCKPFFHNVKKVIDKNIYLENLGRTVTFICTFQKSTQVINVQLSEYSPSGHAWVTWKNIKMKCLPIGHYRWALFICYI